jgi:hypothetical protein
VDGGATDVQPGEDPQDAHARVVCLLEGPGHAAS